MLNYPSRQQKRQSKLYQIAEQGLFELDGLVLYKSEIKSLQKKGFEVLDIQSYPSQKDLYTAKISWEHAFGGSIPHLVYSYVNKVIETFPTRFANTFAKELFIIAKKAQLSKQ